MSERRSEPVTHDEARQILSRFNASHWNDGREKARYTIPCDVDRDDDCLMDQYIAEQREQSARVRELEAEVAHWKANHDEMVRRNATLRDRPDLGDRSRRMQELEAAIDVLGAECRESRWFVLGCEDDECDLCNARGGVNSNPIAAAAVNKERGA